MPFVELPAALAKDWPYALQRVGCEHPVTLAITTLQDPSDVYMCAGCEARWSTWPASRLPWLVRRSAAGT